MDGSALLRYPMYMKIAQITDIHADDFLAESYGIDALARLEFLLGDIRKEKADLIVLTGDLGKASVFPGIAGLLEKGGIPWLYILGNHDEPADYLTRSDWAGGKGNGLPYYSQKTGEDFLIFLDTHNGAVDEKQKHWLEALLGGPEERFVLFSHHPLYDCGGTLMDRLYPLEGRKEITALLEASGKKIHIFCGHYHTVHGQTFGSVTQAVTPSLLVQLKKYSTVIEEEGSEYGYRIIGIGRSGVSSEVRMFS